MAVLEFPPNQSKVLAAFIRRYEDWRKTKLRIESEPDKQDRRSRTCDYVLAGEDNQRIAVEVSTAWRSEAAPKEDKGWSRVWEECERRLNGRVKGTYHICVPLRWPKNLPADGFYYGLLKAVEDYKEPGNADKPVQWMQVCGMSVAVSRFMREGSSVSFARLWSESEGEDMGIFIRRIIKKKAGQSRAWKQQGIETYLVVYNTIWTAIPTDSWRGDLTRDPLIDHFIVVAGNPPDDAWVERIW